MKYSIQLRDGREIGQAGDRESADAIRRAAVADTGDIHVYAMPVDGDPPAAAYYDPPVEARR